MRRLDHDTPLVITSYAEHYAGLGFAPGPLKYVVFYSDTKPVAIIPAELARALVDDLSDLIPFAATGNFMGN